MNDDHDVATVLVNDCSLKLDHSNWTKNDWTKKLPHYINAREYVLHSC